MIRESELIESPSTPDEADNRWLTDLYAGLIEETPESDMDGLWDEQEAVYGHSVGRCV